MPARGLAVQCLRVGPLMLIQCPRSEASQFSGIVASISPTDWTVCRRACRLMDHLPHWTASRATLYMRGLDNRS